MIQRRATEFLRTMFNSVKTAAFVSSLMFTLAFSIITSFAMLLVYSSAEQEISEQVDSRLYAESSHLRRKLEERRRFDLSPPMMGIIERVPNESAMSYCLMYPQGIHHQLPGKLIDLRQQDSLFLNMPLAQLCQMNPNDRGEEHKSRMVIRPVEHGRYFLITAYDTSDERGILQRMFATIRSTTVLLLIISFVGTLYLSSHITHISANIRRTAREIVDGDFSHRIQTNDNDSDEMTLLAKDLNHMLDRIEELVTTQRQVVSNIAHDLRSPLNRMRNRMEVAMLDKNTSCETLREVMRESSNDIDQLLKTFNAILNVAQIESRQKNDFMPTNLSVVCQDLAELYDVVDEEDDEALLEGAHRFFHDIQEHLQVFGNRHLLAQAIINLLDNAMKYTPAGGEIRLNAYQQGNKVIVAVADNGIGIPADKFKEVLKRFVRLDSARSSPGNGLGLALVQAIVSLHDGEIHLFDNEPGLRVELHFPLFTGSKPSKAL